MGNLKFYLLTDTHYFEESLGAEGKAYEEYMKTEAFYLKESSAINIKIEQQNKCAGIAPAHFLWYDNGIV